MYTLLRRLGTALLGLAALCVPVAFAYAGVSVSLKSLLPGATVAAGSALSFTIAPSGFAAQSYQVSDSFGSSSVSAANVDPFAKFLWVPRTSDVGTHTLTITASDYAGDSASTTQAIIVGPAPSVSIGSVSPGTTVMPGTKLSFSVSAPGFTNPSYIVGDSFSGTSVGDNNIDASGNFSWTPSRDENGTHVIMVYGMDAQGHNASASQTIQVGAGPAVTIPSLSTSTSLTIGQNLSFTAYASNFSPTAYSVSDKFSGSTSVSSANINISGNFSWTPQAADIGTHVLTITGVVGSYGQNASTTATITVNGAGGPPQATTTVAASTTPASTVAATSSVSALQAQLAQLLGKIGGLSGTTAASSSSIGFTFNVSLRAGMTNDDVSHLQTVLSQQGFFSDAVNGRYGPATIAAVKKFQAAHGLDQLGVVGPATRTALNAISPGSGAASSSVPSGSSASASNDGYVFKKFIGRGSTGADVIELQKRLTNLGFLSGSATGRFGALTEAAVKKFQAAHHLDQFGYVGPGTRAALNASADPQ